ncbi:MAG: DegT/DnrJ/EryC1/StrS family aminotransferase [Planctomycetota bacterium]|jgi:dTDP-4-amino-4,6-dideoxygalactose transaminase
MTPQSSAKLAIDGGPKVREDPFPPRGLFGEAEKQAAIDLFDRCAETGEAFTYNGPEDQAYCREFADFLGGGFADAVNSGTSAIYVALRALEIEPFTEVIVPAVTDPGGVMPVPLVNCIPVPADAAPGSFNIGADQIAERLTDRTSAIILAHIAGLPADMDPIMELAESRGIPVIEDCAQAHGATYKGRQVGTFGALAAFSTMSGKHHATGGQGGVVYTRDEGLYWRCRRASDRGKPFGLEGATSNVIASLNLNIDELSAAIGRAQLARLPEIIAARRRWAMAVAQGCLSLDAVRLATGLPETEGVFWFLQFSLDADRLGVDKLTFVQALAAEGLPVGASYYHAQSEADWFRNRAVFGTSGYPWTCPLYQGDRDAEYPLDNAKAADARHFRMSFHENWTQREVADTLEALRKVESAYLKGR